MRKGNIQNIIIIISFILLVAMPVLTINRVTGKVSEAENRYLAKFPEILNEQGQLADGLKSGLENWLSDNIGFREQFMKLSTRINYHILKKSPSDKVEIGRDGWFFYTLDDNMKIANGTYPLTEETLAKIALQQEKIKDKLESQGIDYVLILPTSKVSIYPEYIKNGNYLVRRTPVDILADYLQTHTDVKVIRLKDALLDAKRDQQVYFKTDTHWNGQGAYVGYQTVINKLNDFGFSNTKPVKVNLSPVPYRGEFSAMMGDINLLPVEQNFSPEIINPKAKEITSGRLFDIISSIKMNYNIQTPSYLYENPYVQGEKVLMYGDSMFGAWNLPQLFAENFNQFTYIWSYDIQQEVIDAVKPDIVFYEMAERFLNSMDIRSSGLVTDRLENPQAEIISQNAPTEVNRKDSYTFDITVKNTSDGSWSEANKIRLCIWQDGLDSGYRIYLPNGVEIKPGEEYTFTLEGFVAPQADHTYIEFQMLQEGITYFGERERVDIMVK